MIMAKVEREGEIPMRDSIMCYIITTNNFPTTNQQLRTMKQIKRLIIITLLTFCFVTTFSQTTDSLSVFPNPFSSSATIHFEIVQSDTISLRVFNAVGQTERTFFQSTILPSGSYNINLLGDSLVDGIYFIRLDIGSTKSLIKKAVKNSSTSSIADDKVF